jgi:metal transporter CNNM
LLYPIRKKGNLLLCTLVLGNVAVNALLSILIADKFGGTIGFLTSTFIIVIFGEITPQAACQRYSLQVGSRAVPLVRLIMFLLLPATYPLAWCLDKALGKELATTYSNAEMLKLLAIHVREDVMDPETAAVMGGALRYKSMLVKEVMTTMDKTFMLSSEDKLNFETIARMYVVVVAL